jgi:leader peptidase (prepilin peptidase)/N-methyltransferase|tara:strand:+ start:384 stop:1148 length:765 start_codon:yes stop_codon:yes gene_type:complete
VDLAFVIIMGGLWGSFANVCIYRLPEQKSVVSGRSFCPNCKKKIVWYDNIPIISYFLLGAKCRNCKKHISTKYLIVELINTISFITIYYIFGISLTTIFLMSLSLSFLIIFFIDLKHFIIPNELTFTMMFVGFFKSFDPNLHFLFPNYLDSLIGGLFGYGVIWSIIIFYKQIRKKEGMGLGDAKLLAVIGFWFGWISIPFVLFFSSVLALISVTPDLIKKSKKFSSQIPFGPYLILASILFFVSKDKLVNIIFI